MHYDEPGLLMADDKRLLAAMSEELDAQAARDDRDMLLTERGIFVVGIHKLRDENEGLRAENVKLIKEITRLEGLVEGTTAEWVRTFDDMVLVQQRTEAERDALRDALKSERSLSADRERTLLAENERLKQEWHTSDKRRD